MIKKFLAASEDFHGFILALTGAVPLAIFNFCY